MKFKTKESKFYKGNKPLSEQVLEWIEAQDNPVSVRRVFYAMVSAGVITNVQDQYTRISRITTKLRENGSLDWSLIIDDTRGSYKTPSFDTALDCANYALESFRLDRWAGQPKHVQVWVEKRGLVSVLYDTTNNRDVTIVENGGKRLLSDSLAVPLLREQAKGKEIVILYVGDYDPSGLRMDENMIDQLIAWGVYPLWQRVAMTREQIDQFNVIVAYTVLDDASEKWLMKHPDVEILGEKNGKPLVNKLEKDTCAAWFRERNDGELFQVEVDALPADIIQELVASAIDKHLNVRRYNGIKVSEDADRERVQGLLL